MAPALTPIEPIIEALRKLCVLVVESDNNVATDTAQALRVHGHRVETAHDGSCALQAVEREDPDVILLGLDMADMSGLEFAQSVKGRRRQKTPFLVAITERGDDEDYRRSLEAGIDLHLVKPVNLEILLGFLERFHRVVG